MRYKNVTYTAKALMKTRELSKATVNQVARRVCDECIAMCTKLPSKSHFKFATLEQLKNFDDNLLSGELSRRAPTLYTILKSASAL